MFTVRDWRLCSRATVAAALDAEVLEWHRAFAWDIRGAWASIEPARAAGRLPGFLAIDGDGRPVGSTCFLIHCGALQIAVLTSSSRQVTDALVDAIMASPEAAGSPLHAMCVRDAAPGLRQSLSRWGFASVTYRYLETGLGLGARGLGRDGERLDVGPRTDEIRLWRASDFDPFVQLCATAYANPREIRAFAPLGTQAEWRDYVKGLVAGPGCGTWIDDASLVIDGTEPRQLDGALIATSLGDGTGHIAQVAVHPLTQGIGLGRALIERALDAFVARGLERATLVVSAANERAGRLYERLGFADRASFVVAVNRQPRRFNNVALAIGGMSTRR